MFKLVKKIIATTIAAITLLSSSPVNAAASVIMEGALDVSNYTSGDNLYHNEVTAKNDEVIKIKVWYHNTEPADSGKVANNLNIKVTLPTQPSTTNLIYSRVLGSNTSTAANTATVKTSAKANLEYIPGTAWRTYNAGTNAVPNWQAVKIADNITTTGYTIANMNPCYNFQESIVFDVRVKAPHLSIQKMVKEEGSSTWQDNITAHPGDTLAYLIVVTNIGSDPVHNLIIRDAFPANLDYREGSAMLYNGNHPNGTPISDNLINNGIDAGDYAPGTYAQVRFQARVLHYIDSASSWTFTNYAYAKADETNLFYNSAKVTVYYPHEESQTTTTIRIHKFNDKNGNKSADTGEAGLAGVRFRITGNGIDKTVTTDINGYAHLDNLQTGYYTVTEIIPNGWENTTGISITRNVTTSSSTQDFYFGNKKKTIVTPPTEEPKTPETPETPKSPKLPITGPAEALGITLSILGVGGSGLAYRRSKKGLIDSLKLF